MNKRSAIIFDLDGTLTKPCLNFDVIRAEIGVEGPILEALPDLDDATRKRAEEILLRYEQDAAENGELYEGAVEVVATCRAQGHPVAILTRNSRRSLEFVLGKHGIVVDTARTREDGAIKPSAEPVLSICEELHADPECSWMVGDYLFDIISGRAAGSHTVLMIGEKPPPDFADRADHVIRQLSELLPLIATG